MHGSIRNENDLRGEVKFGESSGLSEDQQRERHHYSTAVNATLFVHNPGGRIGQRENIRPARAGGAGIQPAEDFFLWREFVNAYTEGCTPGIPTRGFLTFKKKNMQVIGNEVTCTPGPPCILTVKVW
jgi:hypothetical protein